MSASRAIPPQIAVINESTIVHDDELALICAAIQKGINRDFAPIWHTSVAVAALRKPRTGWWKAHVRDRLTEPGAAGYHTDEHRQPVIYVDASAGDVSLTLDHEVKETLADPSGNHLVAATLHGRRVRVLTEVCDPCEDKVFAYTVDGITVSDFVTPAYYKPPVAGERTGFNSSLPPGTLGRGGYLSYLDDGVWKQDTWFDGPAPTTRVLGRHEDVHRPDEALREMIDRLTRELRV